MERVRQLLDEGAEPGRASLYQLTPLMVATYGGNRELVELLLARGAPTGDVDNSGKSALVYAAARCDPAIFDLLFAQVSDVSRRYHNGLTLLMWAAASGHGH